MAKFSEALKKGLDGHRRAAAVRKEIGEVLSEASKEVSAVFSRPITLEIGTDDRPVRERSFSEMVQTIPAPRRQVEVIAARDPSPRRLAPAHPAHPVVLADFEMDPFGYPVTIRWDRHYEQALDRAGFENAVVKLLASPATGEKLARLQGDDPLIA